ncbi:hypothetical protein V2A60_002251 [Cordyceps javanica]
MTGISLTTLPPEMLLVIASFLGSTANISRLARTNRRMFQTLDRYLYDYDVATSVYCPEALRISSCYGGSSRHVNSVIRKSLAARAPTSTPRSASPPAVRTR